MSFLSTGKCSEQWFNQSGITGTLQLLLTSQCFCRGAHIDVRNKKGNTPLWLAANGGHFDVVQLLVHASADVDAADNRKITPLMAAFRKVLSTRILNICMLCYKYFPNSAYPTFYLIFQGHVKVVQYIVKEVNQFPSDIECMRYIATIADKVGTKTFSVICL